VTKNSFWEEQRIKISNCLNTLPIDTFRGWDPVCSIPLYEVWHWLGYMEGAQKTYFRILGDERVLNKWIRSMSPKTWGFTHERYMRTLSKIKFPYAGFELDTTTYNLKSNHHIETYQQLTSKNILDYDRIVEFGGGTGDLSKLIFDLGYDGEYCIYDIPEVLEIQKLNFIPYNKKPIFTSNIPKYSKNTLFISTWGFSEVPLLLRNKFLDSLQPENWLITTQRNIFGINNDLYFDSWDGKRSEIPWIVWDGGSYYIAK
jgi:hypothetical protein